MRSTCRFVGLLLVTKLLSSGDLPVIKAVYDAVGINFINRLLLPLGRHEVTTAIYVVYWLHLNCFRHHLVSKGRQSAGD